MAGDAKRGYMAQTEKERRERIRILNDQLRTQGLGGSIMITQGIQSLSPDTLAKVMPTIRQFNSFSEDNDPYGEHDCAAIEVDGQRIFWKIDYYDKSMRGGSSDPADPKITERVMTVMLAEEY